MPREKDSIAYTVAEASKATSIGADQITAAIENHDLVAHWVGPGKRVILHADLVDWVATFPTERPAGAYMNRANERVPA